MGAQALGLDEDLMRVLVRESHDLVFHRGTVARSHAFDQTGEHGRSCGCAANDVVGALVGRSDVAGQLTRMAAAGSHVGKHRPGIVAVLFAHHRKIDAAAVDPRRRAGLQAADAQFQLPQPRRQMQRRRIAGAPAGMTLETDVNPAAEESAHGQNYRTRPALDSALRNHARDAFALDNQVGRFLLKQRQIDLGLEHAADRGLVELPIGLHTSGAHRRSLARIQGAELDPRPVGGDRHRTSQRVDLLDQVPLADAADCRVAAHLPQRFDVVSQKKRTPS